MKTNNILSEEGVNGLGIAVVNTNSTEFKILQQTITAHAQQQSPQEILENRLLSLRFQMESYLKSKNDKLVEVGWFLKEFVKALNIKNKVFAAYIGYQESNLSALYKGKRKINVDLALKLGQIFRVAPTLWIHIQSKNELKKMATQNNIQYQKYSIDDLMKYAG